MIILVADDAPESRRLLEMLLGRWGHTVRSVPDGVTALEALTGGEADMAFLDWMMPGLDGPSVCQRVRSESGASGPYIILLTGRAEPEDIARGIEAGADDYIVKPLDAQQLRMRMTVAERAVRQRAALVERTRALEGPHPDPAGPA